MPDPGVSGRRSSACSGLSMIEGALDNGLIDGGQADDRCQAKHFQPGVSMSAQSRPIFDSSFAALALVEARNDARFRSQTRPPSMVLPPTGRSAVPMTIQYAPEPVPTAHLIDLSDDQTTGPLSLGFEFEFFAVRYSWFDMSYDGFIMLGLESRAFWPGSRPGRRFIPLDPDVNNFLALGWSQGCTRNRVRIAYEIRGAAGRRRLVLSSTGLTARGGQVGALTGQLILRERTGMIEVHTARYEPGESRVDERAVRFTTTSW